MFLGKIGVDFSDQWNVGFDYLSTVSQQEITEDVDHAFSLSASYNENYKAGRLALVADLIYTLGADGSDHLGVVVLPTVQLSNRLELVTRYQLAVSEGEAGLRLQKRYEQAVAEDEQGDLYHAGYLGLNYYLRGNELKIMTGVEYSRMEGADFDGWTWISGLRMYF